MSDDDSKTILSKHLAPQYGGAPVELNQRLEQARAIEDTDEEAYIHRMRKALFRNRRSAAEQAEFEAAGRRKFIEKYGVRGEIALKHTDTQRKMAELTPAENAELIVKINAAPPPPPPVKKPTKESKQ